MSLHHRLLVCAWTAGMASILFGVASAQQEAAEQNAPNPFGGPAPKPEIRVSVAVSPRDAPVDPPQPAPAAVAHDGVPIYSKVQARDKIQQALAQPVEVAFADTPLSEVAAFLRDSAGAPIVIDRQALDDAGLGSDTPCTISLKGITLRSTLRIMLDQLDLTYVVRDEVLKITTHEAAANELDTRLYAVADLATREPLPVIVARSPRPFEMLERIILTTIAPDTWRHVGGSGSFESCAPGGFVVISQTDEVHEQIAALLAAVRQFKDTESQQPQDTRAWPATGTAERSALARITEALQRDVALEFADAPLSEVADALRKQFAIPVYIDVRALDDVGLGSDTPITMSLQGISLHAALRLMLKELDLTYVIADEVLKITTPENAEGRPVVCVYSIGDFLRSEATAPDTFPAANQQALREVITSSIAPDTWNKVGGAGTIELAAPWGLMVVSQTDVVHEQIAGLVAAARRMRAPGGDKPNTVSLGMPSDHPERPDQAPLMVFRVYTVSGEATMEEAKAMIQGAVAPESWQGLPHPAAIFPLGRKLLILQTPAVHQQIEALLQATGMAG